LEIKARRRKEACVGRIVREENVFTRAGPSYRMQMMPFSLTSHDRKKREKKEKEKKDFISVLRLHLCNLHLMKKYSINLIHQSLIIWKQFLT